jgi:hypothetical protein
MDERKNLSIDDAIRIFFSETTSEENSSLCLLRRDIKICLGLNGPKHETAIWPATMAILTGIDLLGYYFANDSDKQDEKGVGKRFKCFCKEFLNLDDTDQEAVYQFRNALLHNYGLKPIPRKNNPQYIFEVTYDEHKIDLITQNPGIPDNYRINLFILYEKFEKAISSYYQAVVENKNGEKENFGTSQQYFGLTRFDIETSGSVVRGINIAKTIGVDT